MATVTAANLVIIADNTISLMKNPLLKADFESFSDILSPTILGLQSDAQASVAAAETWISAERKFIVNNDGMSRVIQLNGIDFTFISTGIYCCEPSEADFFVQKATDNGFAIVASTYAAWKAAGQVAFFTS